MRAYRSLVLAATTLSLACVAGLDAGPGDEDPTDRDPEAVTDPCKASRTDRQGTSFPATTRADAVARGKAFVDFRWTPVAKNLAYPTGSNRCGYVVRTSGQFKAGVEQPFPYKKAGYDGLATFEACIGHAYGTSGLYLGGTIDQTSLGRGCGVLGLDCAGFVGKALGSGENEYTTPSFIHNACPLVGDGRDFSKAKLGYLTKRYGVTGKQDHFQLVAFDPDLVARRVTVYEAGTGDPSKRGDIVKEATYDWSFLVGAGFRLCAPRGLLDP